MRKDLLATHRPADRTAARVTQPGPKGYALANHWTTYCEPAPMPMRPVPSGMPNLTGHQHGWLTVIGLAVERGGTGGNRGRWVCRCRCGYYVIRTAKAVRNAANAEDRCDRCRQVAFLQRRAQQIAAGAYPPPAAIHFVRPAAAGDTPED